MLDKVVDTAVKRWVDRIRPEDDLPIRPTLRTGQTYDLGNFEKPEVSLRANDKSAIPVLLDPTLDPLGEAYVQQKIGVEGPLPSVIWVAYSLSSARTEGPGLAAKIVKRLSHTKKLDKGSIQYHYDVSNEFYQLWLDRNMVYSCAYFSDGHETLHEAQLKKIDHILDKIRIRPSHTLLDIGCGWGSLPIRAARRVGIRSAGTTLSERQLELARQRTEKAGLSHLVEFRLQDYRDMAGTFDRITSVGIFEHVGLANLAGYFSIWRNLLTDDDVALNHGITSTDANSGDTPFGGGTFIDKYVFPAGEPPHISQSLKAMQEDGLEAPDVENLRPHYMKTLKCWTSAYEQHGAQICDLIGEARYRIWRVYLAGCAHAFAIDNVAIFQMICQKSGRHASSVPPSRGYIYESAH